MDTTNWMTVTEVMDIPVDHLPLAVLSFNYRNVVSTLINMRKNSHYNHFMWMHKPGKFASQGMFFTEVPVEDYVSHHRLKFWHNPKWTAQERALLLSQIITWLEKPKLTTRYDWIAIFGQLLGIGMLQNPLTRICSDYGSFLRQVDKRYRLKNPAPNDVNNWFQDNSNSYKVYGKYVRD